MAKGIGVIDVEVDTVDMNVHPGEILHEEFMRPLNISQNLLARTIHVPPRRINEIVNCKRGITADTAVRLSKVFGTSSQFWMNLQTNYELNKAQAEIGEEAILALSGQPAEHESPASISAIVH